jgi:hypothetical protein
VGASVNVGPTLRLSGRPSGGHPRFVVVDSPSVGDVGGKVSDNGTVVGAWDRVEALENLVECWDVLCGKEKLGVEEQEVEIAVIVMVTGIWLFIFNSESDYDVTSESSPELLQAVREVGGVEYWC